MFWLRNKKNKFQICNVIEMLEHFSLPVFIQGCIVQSVMCLTADTCLTADPGVGSSILACSHNFVVIDNEINYGHSPHHC